jgi:SAM-dependent methyltransferase
LSAKKREQEEYRPGFEIAEVRAHWDRVAPIYDDANSHKLNPHHWRFIEGIKYVTPSNLSDIKVLSIWSRTGNAIPYIRSKLPNATIYNLEASEKMIEIAQGIHPSENFQQTDLNVLELEDDSIDYIMSPETFEHTPNPENLIREFHRVLKRDGKLILSLPPRVADIHQWVYETFVGGHGDGPRKGIPSWIMKRIINDSSLRLELHKAILFIPIGPKWLVEFGDKVMKALPFLKELGVMQFYICAKKPN